jgi:DNA repair photolyase
VYSNLPEKLAAELPRKRKPVWRVYFSPSCDCFQPLAEVQDVTYEVMRVLLKRGVSVALLTKGAIPERFLDLFARAPRLVHAQIGITTLYADIAKVIEPNATMPEDRVRNIRELVRLGVHASARLDPLIPFVTDTDENLEPLLDQVADAGVKEIAVNYLFLRAALRGRLLNALRKVTPEVSEIEDLFTHGTDLAMYQDRSHIRTPPTEYRREQYERIKRLAQRRGLRMHICGCKNSDLTTERCHIAGPSAPSLFSS